MLFKNYIFRLFITLALASVISLLMSACSDDPVSNNNSNNNNENPDPLDTVPDLSLIHI